MEAGKVALLEGESTRRVAAQRWEEWRYGAARSTRSLAIARRNFWKLPEWRGAEAEPSSRRRGVARMGGVEQWSRGIGDQTGGPARPGPARARLSTARLGTTCLSTKILTGRAVPTHGLKCRPRHGPKLI